MTVQVIPLIQKVNLVHNGDVDETSSSSSFTYFTIIFLSSMTELVTTKYVGALSDYVGRKPLLLGSAIVFAIGHFMLAALTTDGAFYTAAVIVNTLQTQQVLTAWTCDLVEDQGRGTALGILIGMSIGLSFTLGLPLGSFYHFFL